MLEQVMLGQQDEIFGGEVFFFSFVQMDAITFKTVEHSNLGKFV